MKIEGISLHVGRTDTVAAAQRRISGGVIKHWQKWGSSVRERVARSGGGAWVAVPEKCGRNTAFFAL